LTALVAALALFPVLVSALRCQNRKWRRLVLAAWGAVVGLSVVLSVPTALSAFESRAEVKKGIDATHQALREVASGNAPAAVTQLKLATIDLGRAQRRTAAWSNLGGYLVPIVAQHQRAVAGLTRAGRNLTVSAAHHARAVDFRGLKYQDGQISLEAIRALAPPVDSLDTQVAAAQAAVSHNSSGWLLAPIARRLDRLRTELSKAKAETELAHMAVASGPALLGADGVRHYIVVFMTPAETRGLDGFIGAYGMLTVDHGRIRLTSSGRAADLSNHPPPLPLKGPLDYLFRYGSFAPQNHFEDLAYSPDFPTVASVISGLYQQTGGGHVDGVLSLDPYALGALLQLTGPFSIPGLTDQLTSSNAADVLLRQQYTVQPQPIPDAQRRDLLQDALRIGFLRLASASLPAPSGMASVLGPQARQGHLLFWSNHPADQPLLRRLRLDGAFPQPGPGSDVLAVTVANAANNKIDAYLHERVTDLVHYHPATGEVTSTVTISLGNAVPTTGLSDYVIGSYAGSGLPPRTNFMWLSVYSPLQLAGASVDQRPIAFSTAMPELGVSAYSTYLAVPAQSTVVLTLSFAGKLRPNPTYDLSLRLQPLVNEPIVSVSVDPSPGWKTTDPGKGPWILDSDAVQRRAWRYVKGK
jgi:hypothetical protein